MRFQGLTCGPDLIPQLCTRGRELLLAISKASVQVLDVLSGCGARLKEQSPEKRRGVSQVCDDFCVMRGLLRYVIHLTGGDR
jgi:hypothetical protein